MAQKYKHVSHDITQLGTGLHVFAETRDLDLSSCGVMLDKFNDDIDPTEPLTAKPLAMVLNPTGKDGRWFPWFDAWVIVFRGNYYVVIEKHPRYVSGPHKAKLKYKSYQTGQVFWIATFQMCDCMFYNEELISIRVFNAVIEKLWYISDRSRKDAVVI